MKSSVLMILTVVLFTTLVFAGGEPIPLEPVADSGSYAGQALDVKENLAAVGHKIKSSYAIRFYEHSTTGWNPLEAMTIGSRRGVSLAFGDDFLGVALSGSGNAGVVLEPSKTGWVVTSELLNPDSSRFNSFSLAAASNQAIFIACNDTSQQYRDAVLVYERVAGEWQHIQTIAPWSASCTLFAGDIDAAGDMLVIGATPVYLVVRVAMFMVRMSIFEVKTNGNSQQRCKKVIQMASGWHATMKQ